MLLIPIEDNEGTLNALTSILPRLPDFIRHAELTRVLELARKLRKSPSRITALSRLAEMLPEVDRAKVLGEVVLTEVSPSGDWEFTRSLLGLVPFLTPTDRERVVRQALLKPAELMPFGKGQGALRHGYLRVWSRT